MSARLRIYSDQEPSERITLGLAFKRLLLPQLKRWRCSDSHITRFATAIGHWQSHTDDRDVRAIDDACLQGFLDTLLEAEHAAGKRGNENVRKLCEYVCGILRACCPRSTRNRYGQPEGRHLITELPIAIPPVGDKQKKRTAAAEDISRAYEAAEIATWPRSRHRSLFDGPVALWRLLFVLSYHYGPRTEDLLGLCWESVHWEAECPAEEVSRLACPAGWLVYVPSKTQGSKPDPLCLPLTECARRHLEAMRPGLKPRGPIFGFPRNKRDLHDTRKAIWREAGIERPYTFQELRKTCSSTWSDQWPGLGKHVTGHAARGINEVHYDTNLRRLCLVAPQLPQPEAFLKAVGLDHRTHRSARTALAERVGNLSEEQAKLILQVADNMVG